MGGLNRRPVERVAEYVDADLSATITLDGMAAVAALSPYYFARRAVPRSRSARTR